MMRFAGAHMAFRAQNLEILYNDQSRSCFAFVPFALWDAFYETRTAKARPDLPLTISIVHPKPTGKLCY
jgi:hypothetical protein